MNANSQQSESREAAWIVVGGFALLILLRLQWPERAMDALGPTAFWDHVFALTFTGFVLTAALGLGGWLLRLLSVDDKLGDLEQIIHALALGLGGLGFLFMSAGVLSLLNWAWIAATIAILLASTSSYWFKLGRSVLRLASDIRERWRSSSVLGRTTTIALAGIFAASSLHTLTPAWSFDGLMYHLAAPKQYLQVQQLKLLPDIWQANGPMGVELLYAAGLAFGSTSVARCLHLVFGVLLVLSAYTFGRRFLGTRVGVLSALIVVAVPIFPIWAGLANIDAGWALYESLAIFAAVTWIVERDRSWLGLSAVLMGMGLTTKYLAWAGFICIIAVLLVAYLMKHDEMTWKRVGAFALVGLLIGSPWYLLNVVRAGNPIYPFVFGGPEWDQERLRYLTTYLSSFGHPNKFLSWLLAPLWLFLRNDLYSSFMSTIEYPSFLFPLALLVPLYDPPKSLRWLAGAALIRFFLWGMTSQQTRFLLPLFPMLAILTAFALTRLASSRLHERTQRILAHGLVGGLLATTLVFQGILWLDMKPGGVLLGTQSKHTFLHRNSDTYAGQAFIQSELPHGSRVLMLYDGQGFYCDARCVPDTEQSKWTQIVRGGDSTQAVMSELDQKGITHLLVRQDALNFFLHHDPKGWNENAIRFYLERFRSDCTTTNYQVRDLEIVELTCS